MYPNTERTVSFSETERNLSRTAKIAEAHEKIDILENNESKYPSAGLEKDISVEMTDNEKIDLAAARILEIYRPAFEELAK